MELKIEQLFRKVAINSLFISFSFKNIFYPCYFFIFARFKSYMFKFCIKQDAGINHKLKTHKEVTTSNNLYSISAALLLLIVEL